MQEHFDEIEKHLEDTEEETTGENEEVPGDRDLSSRPDTSYINGVEYDVVIVQT